MPYTLVYTDDVRVDIEQLKKSGDMAAIRKLARMLINPQFDDVHWFSEGRAAVNIAGKWGF